MRQTQGVGGDVDETQHRTTSHKYIRNLFIFKLMLPAYFLFFTSQGYITYQGSSNELEAMRPCEDVDESQNHNTSDEHLRELFTADVFSSTSTAAL